MQNNRTNSPSRLLDPFILLAVTVIVCSVCLLFFTWTHQHTTILRSHIPDIPAELFAYQQTSLITCSLEGEAACFAVLDDSTFLVGIADPPALHFIDHSGASLRQIVLPEEPRAVAVGITKTILSDKIVVALPNQIAVYTLAGEQEALWRLPFSLANFSHASESGVGSTFIPPPENRNHNVRSLALTPEYLFIADSTSRLVHRLKTDGTADLTIGETALEAAVQAPWLEKGFGGFVVYASPITLAYSHYDDLLYIANPGRHRVDVFTQDGTYKPELSWGEPSTSLSGFAGCCNPIGVAVLEDGGIMTTEKGRPLIKVFRTGEMESVAATQILENLPSGFERVPMKPGGRIFAAMPLTVLSPEGGIAVFDFDYKVIRTFMPKIE